MCTFISFKQAVVGAVVVGAVVVGAVVAVVVPHDCESHEMECSFRFDLREKGRLEEVS